MSDFIKILEKLSDGDNDRLLKVARFAELGMNASAVIHEIRQPLTALSMSLQMVMESLREGSHDIEHNVREAVKLVSKTEQLVERARDFMSPSSEIREVDLVDCITKVLSAFQWQLGHRPQIVLRAHAPEQLPTICADGAHIEQLLANLVSNSLDALDPHKGGLVWVEAHFKDEYLDIVVADDGNGMSDEVKEKAFEPFFSTKGNQRGTGLGLFIVAQIVARYSGKCQVLSKEELATLSAPNLNTGIRLLLPVESKA